MMRVLFLLFVSFSVLCSAPVSNGLLIESEYLNPFSGKSIDTEAPALISVETFSGESVAVSLHDSLAPVYLSYKSVDSSHFGTVQLRVNSNEFDSLQLILSLVSDSIRSENIAVNGKKYLHRKKLPGSLSSGAWGGVRTKFWATLLSPADGVVEIDYGESEVVITLKGSTAFEIYSGPVDREALRNGTADLSPLLYYELWPWVRWISIGLQKLLHFFVSLVKSYGVAIILLSVFVKIAMYPLVKIADKWQEDVNRTKSLLQPKIDEITKAYKGEEQHNRIMALYKENGVSPFYTIKSLAGFFIQIPIFFAAYHTLGEELSLKGFSFLWIGDLAIQDHFLKLPFSLPYFGEYLNLLPLLMTVITILSAFIHTDESLSPQLLKKQRINLYSMAFIFFVLFYRFPAAMVLYWTMNNVAAFIKALYLKFFKGKRA